MKTIEGKDLLPLEGLTRADEDWLRSLQEHVRVDEHVIRLGGASEESEPIVACGPDGRWRAGRYIGTISLGSRRLVVHPRFRHEVLEGWIGAALNLVVVPRSSTLRESEAIFPLLLALIWCREFDDAARHGLPFLRVRRPYEGLGLRGRLDVQRTVKRRAQGRRLVNSEFSVRTLEHNIARTIVCAHRALSQMVGSHAWMTDRVRDLMPHLWGAVGTRPRLPSKVDLARIRYTPIRLPFRSFVDRSWTIARQRGFASAGSEDESEGVLLDIAELWELFVARCTERAFPTYEVVHSATAGNERVHPDYWGNYQLRSTSDPSQRLGRLIPDVLVRSGLETVAIVDAKYKPLRNRTAAQDGVMREDRYQLGTYLAALGNARKATGMLAYPAEVDEKTGLVLESDRAPFSRAEQDGPWLTADRDTMLMRRLPVEVDGCVTALQHHLREVVAVQGSAVD